MADEEEELERQLELQLQEQRDSLSSLNEALASDPDNPEFLAIHEELVAAIKDAEEGLLHLKRARLLREVDSVVQSSESTGEDDVKAEPIDPNDIEAELLEEEQAYSVGSKCRFRHSDGRWYNGQIVGLDSSGSAKISFLTPRSENMLICKFFLQQRCRFGTNCRLSHGVDVPVSSLKKFIPTVWEQSLVGSTIWAGTDSKPGIWREAELESWDSETGMGHVVFRDKGGSAMLGTDSLALSLYAPQSDEEDEETSDSSLEESDDSDYGDEEVQGLGFVESTAQQRGVQKGTAIFAKWENHTRGIASRMMASMGYREGMGLGASGQGMVNPIPVKVLPPKQSLDHALKSVEKSEDKENKRKKRSRGGKRKREKKFAEASRALEDEEESRPDMFSFINTQLAMHAEASNKEAAKKKQNKGSEEKKIDRRDLLAYDDEVKELRVRVEKLEEMVTRNRKEKAVYEAAMRKLVETRKALEEAEAAHVSASNALSTREKEKRWLKF
ncbi:hypothetical protein CDL15_Pgr015861 [Punica granatum]|uniref:Zinc finger CCCH domain-containing protein 18 n=1 Tax=Punica granatum TaxID=22663 RepID=A0A218XNK8_PUNGR|nr:hypothetical protein CDL15_Pgr015861 [Punica granatum]